jgi:predicted transcriptional regulator YheO
MELRIDAETLADFVAALLGPDSEIAVHDLSDPSSSLKVLRNGVLSGRGVGAPATDLALRMAQECSGPGKANALLNYRSKTRDGVSLRSSTLVIKDQSGKVVSMFCVNTDDGRFRRALEAVQALLPADLSNEQHQEHLSGSVDDVGVDIMQGVLGRYPVEPARLSAEEKAKAVSELDCRGLFSIRGFVGKAAQALDISEPTLYRYLKNSRE